MAKVSSINSTSLTTTIKTNTITVYLSIYIPVIIVLSQFTMPARILCLKSTWQIFDRSFVDVHSKDPIEDKRKNHHKQSRIGLEFHLLPLKKALPYLSSGIGLSHSFSAKFSLLKTLILLFSKKVSFSLRKNIVIQVS
eukprot:TRINITY_DN909_c0_g2_i4.p1 TRINITY_DN909_c0_g2~~TRINITY_DN909_c0_g2_i4.p1  ORF type:complete len:138 (+),score=4.09 TRINITY_DN909_c0_g2_i4:158-571(+)